MPIVVGLLGIGTAVVIQWTMSARSAEFAGPDESAHFVTAVMVHDYLATGLGQPPMSFAESYYARFPKVAMGHWPPAAYAAVAAWIRLLGVSRETVLAFVALATGVVVAGIAKLVHDITNDARLGLLAVAAYLVAPRVHESVGVMMLELPLSAILVWAVVIFASAWRLGGARRGLAFGLVAAAALLTKASGAALALLPLVMTVLTRQWRVWRTPVLWVAAGTVFVLAAPWYWFARSLQTAGWQGSSSASWLAQTVLPTHLSQVVGGLGILVVVLSCVGAAWRARDAGDDGAAAPSRAVIAHRATAAALIAVVLFHVVVVPVRDERHTMYDLPFLVVLAAAGAQQIGRWARRPELGWVLLLAVTLVSGWRSLPPATTRAYGASPLVARLAPDVAETPVQILVSSDAFGEGALIAELVLALPLHARVNGTSRVQRASQLLATADWSGQRYASRIVDSNDLIAALCKAKVSWLAVDNTPSVGGGPAVAHHAIVLAWVASAPRGVVREPLSKASSMALYRLNPEACP